MNKIPNIVQSFLMLILILSNFALISSSYAYTKQWPLRSMGEVRYLKMIKVYDIGLYSPSELSPKTILEKNISKCLKLKYAVDLSVDKFRLATKKILQRQHSPEHLANINDTLTKFQNAYQAVKKGDTYTLCYNGKNQQLQLDLNDKKLIQVQSAEFAKAYLGIWLSGNKPISRPLYRAFFSTK